MQLFRNLLAAGVAAALAAVPASAQPGPTPEAAIEGHCSCNSGQGTCDSGNCACHGAGHSGHGAPGVPADLQSHPFVKEMDRDMGKMMRDMHGSAYSGNWDIDFLTMMIPHHQGAIDMARLVLIHGKDPLTRTLAEDIIASQQAEIDAMKARLAFLKKATAGEFPSLEGTRGAAASTPPEKLRAPESTPGPAPDAPVDPSLHQSHHQ